MNFLFLRNIPYSYLWIIHQSIGRRVKTVLDLGCGNGVWMEAVCKDKKWKIQGVEIYRPSVQTAKKRGIYETVLQADLTKLPSSITKQKFDLVFSSQVVEHLSKRKALKLIKQMEKLAKKRVMISTTVGFMHFCPLDHCHEDENNPYQKHQSAWSPEEFRKLGYTTHGQGLALVYREGNLGFKVPKFLLPVLYGFAFLCSPLVYYFPTLGTYQIAYKDIL